MAATEQIAKSKSGIVGKQQQTVWLRQKDPCI